MTQFDPENLYLSSSEEALFLRYFKRTDTAVLTKDKFCVFREKNLIRDSMDGESGWFGNERLPDRGICQLNENGKRFRAFLLKERRAERNNNIRYCITTGIAVAALFLAILSLTMQCQ